MHQIWLKPMQLPPHTNLFSKSEFFVPAWYYCEAAVGWFPSFQVFWREENNKFVITLQFLQIMQQALNITTSTGAQFAGVNRNFFHYLLYYNLRCHYENEQILSYYLRL